LEHGKISGEIRNISLSPIAEGFVLPVSENGSFSLFLFSSKSKNIKKGSALFMHGLRQAPVGDLVFHSVDISEVIRIGQTGEAHKILNRQRNRFIPAALAIIGTNTLESFLVANDYMCQRYQTGTLLIEKSQLKVMLTDIKSLGWEAIYASKRLAMKADFTKSEIFIEPFVYFRDKTADVLKDAVQLLGGYGYMRDFPQEKHYRDGRQLQAVFGISEFLKSDLIYSEKVV